MEEIFTSLLFGKTRQWKTEGRNQTSANDSADIKDFHEWLTEDNSNL